MARLNVTGRVGAIVAHAQAILDECAACEGQTDFPSQEVFNRMDRIATRGRELRREAAMIKSEIAQAQTELES